MENGEPEFGYADHSGIYTVELPTSLMLEAADYIEAATSRQRERIRELEEALQWILSDYEGIGAAGFPPCANWDLRVEKARKALSATAQGESCKS